MNRHPGSLANVQHKVPSVRTTNRTESVSKDKLSQVESLRRFGSLGAKQIKPAVRVEQGQQQAKCGLCFVFKAEP